MLSEQMKDTRHNYENMIYCTIKDSSFIDPFIEGIIEYVQNNANPVYIIDKP